MKRTERKMVNYFKDFDHLIDEDYKELYDKYKNLKRSHKKQEKLLMDYRNALIALQDGIKFNVILQAKEIQEKLRHVNLALGFNQWTSVKEVK